MCLITYAEYIFYREIAKLFTSQYLVSFLICHTLLMINPLYGTHSYVYSQKLLLQMLSNFAVKSIFCHANMLIAIRWYKIHQISVENTTGPVELPDCIVLTNDVIMTKQRPYSDLITWDYIGSIIAQCLIHSTV